MSEALLELDDVTACYGRLPVLHGVSLDVKPGEIVALIGANGAGKTTTMMTICGRPRASQGRIVFDGAALPSSAELVEGLFARLRERGVEFVTFVQGVTEEELASDVSDR